MSRDCHEFETLDWVLGSGHRITPPITEGEPVDRQIICKLDDFGECRFPSGFPCNVLQVITNNTRRNLKPS